MPCSVSSINLPHLQFLVTTEILFKLAWNVIGFVFCGCGRPFGLALGPADRIVQACEMQVDAMVETVLRAAKPTRRRDLRPS